MWTFFLLIGFIFLFAIFVAISFILTLISRLFGGLGKSFNLFNKFFGGKNNKSNRNTSSNAYNSNNSYSEKNSSASSGSSSSRNGKKVFGDDEGKYVDFEEIKE